MTTEIYWVDQPHRWRGEAVIFSQSVTNLLGVLFTQGQSSDTSISIPREAMFFKSLCKKKVYILSNLTVNLFKILIFTF